MTWLLTQLQLPGCCAWPSAARLLLKPELLSRHAHDPLTHDSLTERLWMGKRFSKAAEIVSLVQSGFFM